MFDRRLPQPSPVADLRKYFAKLVRRGDLNNHFGWYFECRGAESSGRKCTLTWSFTLLTSAAFRTVPGRS